MSEEKKFKWASPHDWLKEHIQKLVSELNVQALAMDFEQLASECDADTIQDLFQPDMSADGYFDEVTDDEVEEEEDDEEEVPCP